MRLLVLLVFVTAQNSAFTHSCCTLIMVRVKRRRRIHTGVACGRKRSLFISFALNRSTRISPPDDSRLHQGLPDYEVLAPFGYVFVIRS
ncbi:hypothetical protein BKA63DRAFT_137458 [Paraphoma chrysanthemicola]|nr:hypothetical protein BKA63DRAFT_137458 [Paraphoma chrysanthemicola]